MIVFLYLNIRVFLTKKILLVYNHFQTSKSIFYNDNVFKNVIFVLTNGKEIVYVVLTKCFLNPKKLKSHFEKGSISWTC